MDIGLIQILAAKNIAETCKRDNIYKLKTNPRIFRLGKLIIFFNYPFTNVYKRK